MLWMSADFFLFSHHPRPISSSHKTGNNLSNSINKSFIFKNSAFGFKNKSFGFKNKTFIYRFGGLQTEHYTMASFIPVIHKSAF